MPIDVEFDRVRLTLVAAADDPARSSRELQKSFSDAVEQFEADGTRLSPRLSFRDVASGGAHLTGDLMIAAQTLGPLAGAIFDAWLRGRSGRRVRLKLTDTSSEVEAGTPEELEKLLAMVREHKRGLEPKIIP